MTATSPTSTIDPTVHLGLVHFVIRRHGYAQLVARNANLELDDLVQAGLMGVMHAARKFDASRGDAAFGTYAVHWIRHFIARTLTDQSSTVRVPGKIQFAWRKAGKPMRPTIYSLDCPLESDDGESHVDTLASPEPDDAYEPAATLDELIAAAELSPRETQVLRFRAAGDSMEAIAQELGITRQRVQQIDAKAIAKLRAANGIVVDDDLVERVERRDSRHAQHRDAKRERTRAVVLGRAAGKTFAQIARELGVTPQRIAQIDAADRAARAASREAKHRAAAEHPA